MIGIVHWAAFGRWESIAEHINNIDIAWPLRNALFEDKRAFVNQRIQTALQYFLVAYLTLLNTQGSRF